MLFFSALLPRWVYYVSAPVLFAPMFSKHLQNHHVPSIGQYLGFLIIRMKTAGNIGHSREWIHFHKVLIGSVDSDMMYDMTWQQLLWSYKYLPIMNSHSILSGHTSPLYHPLLWSFVYKFNLSHNIICNLKIA